ncbi:MAG TPA: DUF5666 domain-containing protein [Vicinamibacteria bacterium]
MKKRAIPFPFFLAVAVAGVTVACGGGSSSVSGPDMSPAAVSPVGGATIAGTVLTGGTASSEVGASSVSGLRVSVSGTGLRTTTDGSGRFTLAGVPAGRAELRFEGPGIDARLQIESLQSGQTLTVTVRVSGNSAAQVSDVEDEDEVEFEGQIDSVGSGSLVVAGRTVHVDASTRILDSHKMPIPLSSLKPGDIVEVEGTARPDGSVLALKVKLEGEEDDDDGHGQEVEFEGTITVLAPLTVGGRLVTTDGSTRYFGRKKETLTAADVLKIGSRVEVEGFQQPDNSVLARKIELED